EPRTQRSGVSGLAALGSAWAAQFSTGALLAPGQEEFRVDRFLGQHFRWHQHLPFSFREPYLLVAWHEQIPRHLGKPCGPAGAPIVEILAVDGFGIVGQLVPAISEFLDAVPTAAEALVL